MAFQGAIFDLDGVIADTASLHYAAWQHVCENIYHKKFTKEDYEDKVNGRRSKDTVKLLLPQLSIEDADKALEIKGHYYSNLIKEGQLKAFPHTVRLIKELAETGVKLSVSSSSRHAAFVLKQLDIFIYFDIIISGNDIQFGKPHPQPFLKAAEYLGLDPHECIVFEDSKVGIEAAKAGGFTCIGIDRTTQPYNYHKADLCVTDLAEVNHSMLNDLFYSREALV